MYRMLPRRGSRGFTLIELLVVIAIIGLLSSVVLASLNGARLKGRNARRLADLRQLQTALEMYYDTQSPTTYPVQTGGLVTATLSGLTPTYIGALPTDPSRTNDATGGYQYCSDGQQYMLVALPEVQSGTAAWCYFRNGGAPTGCTLSATTQCK